MFSLVGFDCKGQVIPISLAPALLITSVWKQLHTSDLAVPTPTLRDQPTPYPLPCLHCAFSPEG